MISTIKTAESTGSGIVFFLSTATIVESAMIFAKITADATVIYPNEARAALVHVSPAT